MTNIDCTKLNKCLYELDTLEYITLLEGEHTLQMHFGSPNGGCYEDVKLVISFIFPAIFHLPAQKHGIFECMICNDSKIKELVPSDFQDAGSLLMCFKIDSQATPFYVYCDEVEWKLTGCGPIQNEHELISNGKIGVPDLPICFMKNLNKFNEILLSSLHNAIKESGLEDAAKTADEIAKLKRLKINDIEEKKE